jgi:hypothetical protein
MAIIAVFNDRIQAQLAKNILENEGIMLWTTPNNVLDILEPGAYYTDVTFSVKDEDVGVAKDALRAYKLLDQSD